MSPIDKPAKTKTAHSANFDKDKTINSYAPSSALALDNLNTANPIAIQRTASSYSAAYFDALYSDNNDPWQYQTRWYEKRKRDICLAVLPQSRYDHAIELGCGNGIFSELLAKRCQALVSIDGNKNAVQLAKQRLTRLPHVKVLQGIIPGALLTLDDTLLQDDAVATDEHHEPAVNNLLSNRMVIDEPLITKSATHYEKKTGYDLIVISEILYYLSAADIDRVILWIQQNLNHNGTLLCCHWRYAIDGFDMTGDLVHQRLSHAFDTTTYQQTLPDGQGAQVPFTHQTKLAESDFLLDVWRQSSQSVAMQENLI